MGTIICIPRPRPARVMHALCACMTPYNICMHAGTRACVHNIILLLEAYIGGWGTYNAVMQRTSSLQACSHAPGLYSTYMCIRINDI